MVEDPKTWTSPTGPWHPNFDPVVEVEMLRTFSLRLIGQHPHYGVRLVITEPGYMHVEVTDGEEAIASVLISLDSEDGINWRYQYSLASKDARSLDFEFDAAEMDSAVNELHRYAANRNRPEPPGQ